MTTFAHALNTALLHFIWQGIAGALLLAFVLFLLRKRSPHSRYLASCLVLAVMALAPVATGIAVYRSFTSVDGMAPPAARTTLLSTSAVSAAASSFAGVSRTTFDQWILPIWATGVICFALRLAWAGGHASSLVRHGVQADESMQARIAELADRVGVRRHVRVLLSAIAEVPGVVGWIRPVVLLPASVVVGLTPQQLEALIVHELAHVRRYDYLVNIFQMIVESLLFYHPAVWWVSSRIRYERELCCDDFAVGACGDAISYARALAQLERLRPATSLAMGSANGPLLHRIQRVLHRENTERVSSRFALASGILAAVICLAFGVDTAGAQQEDLAPLVKRLALSQVPAAPPLAVLPELVPATVPPLRPKSPLAPPQQLSPPQPPPLASALQVEGVLLKPQAREGEETRWVLFTGTDVRVRGTAADETAARRAKQSVNGDMLWFSIDGKAYVTQDKVILEQMRGDLETLAAQLDQLVREMDLARVNSQQEARLAQASAQQRAVEDAMRKLDELNGELRNQQRSDRSQDMSREIERALQKQAAELKRSAAEIEAATAELKKMHQQLRERSNLEMEMANRARENSRLQDQRKLEILREAVRNGRAQEVR